MRATLLALAMLAACPSAWAEGAAAGSSQAGGVGVPVDAALVERVAALEGAYKHLATKADIERVNGRISGLEGQQQMLIQVLGAARH